MFSRVIAILSVLALSACSVDTIDDSDVNQDKLYGDYRVTFDDADKQLRHYVQFRVAGSTGTTVRLSEGTIELDGAEMSIFDGDEAFINIAGTYYRRTYDADMPNASYTYTWTRGDGQSFNNVATMPQPFTVESPTAGDVVPKETALTVVLAGDDLGANEHYWVTIESEAPMGQEQIMVTSESGSEVVISTDELSRLPPGPAVLRVKRTRVEPTQAGHTEAGGSIETHYELGEIELEVAIDQPVG